MTDANEALRALEYVQRYFDKRAIDYMDEQLEIIRAHLTDTGYVRVPVGILDNLKEYANARYAAYIDKMRSTECLGHEYKMQNGCFGEAELSAHSEAAKLLGEHLAFSESTRLLAATKENSHDSTI